MLPACARAHTHAHARDSPPTLSMRAYVVWGMLLVGCCAPVALAFDGAGSRGQSRADMSRSALVPGGPPYIYWTAQACCAEHSHLQPTGIFRQSLNSAGGNATVVYMPSSAAQSVSNLAVGDYYLHVLVAFTFEVSPTAAPGACSTTDWYRCVRRYFGQGWSIQRCEFDGSNVRVHMGDRLHVGLRLTAPGCPCGERARAQRETYVSTNQTEFGHGLIAAMTFHEGSLYYQTQASQGV